MIVRNETKNEVLASQVERATSFLDRGLGLLPRASVAADEGLWIDGCGSVHTMFMRATIDVIFLDRDGTVLKVCGSVPPFKPLVACKGAKTVVELGSGSRPASDVAVGDRLSLQ